VTRPTGMAGVSAAFVNGGTFGAFAFTGALRACFWKRERSRSSVTSGGSLQFYTCVRSGHVNGQPIQGKETSFSAFHVHLIPTIQSPFAASAETSSSSQPTCGMELERSEKIGNRRLLSNCKLSAAGARPPQPIYKARKTSEINRFWTLSDGALPLKLGPPNSTCR
jgi:hypothetical protein